jgi:hypothetical protein
MMTSTTPQVDQYGLLIDTEGDFTLTADYTSDLAYLGPLPSDDPDYNADWDDDTEDGDAPVSKLQKKYRIRLRDYRHKLKISATPSALAALASLRWDLHDKPVQEKIAYLKAAFVAQLFGFNITN